MEEAERTTKRHTISRLLRFKTKKKREPIRQPEDPKEDPQLETVAPENRKPSRTPEAPHKSEALICPNEQCGKTISKPLKVDDLSKKPKETFYVCPYCMSRLDVKTLELRGPPKPVSIKEPVSVEKGRIVKETSPKKCPQFLGYLKKRPKNAPIPDECLTCPEAIKCLLG